MAHREDHHRHQQLHYASILPANNIPYPNYPDPRAAAAAAPRRASGQERTRAVSLLDSEYANILFTCLFSFMSILKMHFKMKR